MNDYLIHYGRKGQKWGKHIFGKPVSRGNSSSSLSKMSDDELRSAIARGKMVSEYRNLENTVDSSTGVTGFSKKVSNVGSNVTNFVSNNISGAAKVVQSRKGMSDDKELSSSIKDFTKQYADASKGFSKLPNTVSKMTPKKDVSHMTNKELGEAIARKRLEADYVTYCKDRKRNESGRLRVMQVITGIVTVAGLVGSVAGAVTATKGMYDAFNNGSSKK